MPEITTLKIRGLFTEDDLKELMLAVRKINDRHPDLNYHFEIEDGSTMPTDQVMAMMERIYPVRPDHALELTFIPKSKLP